MNEAATQQRDRFRQLTGLDFFPFSLLDKKAFRNGITQQGHADLERQLRLKGIEVERFVIPLAANPDARAQLGLVIKIVDRVKAYQIFNKNQKAHYTAALLDFLSGQPGAPEDLLALARENVKTLSDIRIDQAVLENPFHGEWYYMTNKNIMVVDLPFKENLDETMPVGQYQREFAGEAVPDRMQISPDSSETDSRPTTGGSDGFDLEPVPGPANDTTAGPAPQGDQGPAPQLPNDAAPEPQPDATRGEEPEIMDVDPPAPLHQLVPYPGVVLNTDDPEVVDTANMVTPVQNDMELVVSGRRGGLVQDGYIDHLPMADLDHFVPVEMSGGPGASFGGMQPFTDPLHPAAGANVYAFQQNNLNVQNNQTNNLIQNVIDPGIAGQLNNLASQMSLNDRAQVDILAEGQRQIFELARQNSLSIEAAREATQNYVTELGQVFAEQSQRIQQDVAEQTRRILEANSTQRAPESESTVRQLIEANERAAQKSLRSVESLGKIVIDAQNRVAQSIDTIQKQMANARSAGFDNPRSSSERYDGVFPGGHHQTVQLRTGRDNTDPGPPTDPTGQPGYKLGNPAGDDIPITNSTDALLARLVDIMSGYTGRDALPARDKPAARVSPLKIPQVNLRPVNPNNIAIKVDFG
jgi:hypothetical protein